MPIYLQKGLPAIDFLKEENIDVKTFDELEDKEHINIALLNLMPTKVETERDIARILSGNSRNIKLNLVHIHGHVPHNTPWEHIEKFYTDSRELGIKHIDGLIITGAPVEMIDFEEVTYWNELTKVLGYVKEYKIPTLYICWAAQAGLYYHYGTDKHLLPKKLFGVFPHYITNNKSKMTIGLDDIINIPHSRHTTVNNKDIENNCNLDVIIKSDEAGIYMAISKDQREVYVTGHIEYSSHTLDKEYKRDVNKGIDIDIPVNYYKDNNPDNEPVVTWRANGNIIFNNWINHYIRKTR